MPIDPRFLPPAEAPDQPPFERTAGSRLPATTLEASPVAGATPNLGHAAIFAVFVLLAGILVGVLLASSLRRLGPMLHESAAQMQSDPRLVLPVEAIVYGLAAGAAALLFPLLWDRSFAEGIHWRGSAVRRRGWVLVAIGVTTSIVVQLLSNFLPIPKELPIDKFFTNPVGVWLLAIFGVTVAPAFEELAFRGFLLPSLATSWDWVVARNRLRQGHRRPVSAEDWQAQAAVYGSLPPAGENVFHRPAGHTPKSPADAHHPDPRWSLPALVFATVITSIGFALLHSDQLAHSVAPLGVLFVVSVVLCVTRLRFQSLAASTLVHSLYNATIFTMLFLGTDGFRHLDKLGK